MHEIAYFMRFIHKIFTELTKATVFENSGGKNAFS